ncbi:alpha/beta hydrolase [Caulobacter sp. 17J65-9]|uniref:alpha/beta fold hydrolase n=1 Tax=Caulobacter sp. 17J65-9 TaxID=2709382 RepID=UPI0013CDAE2D|nr:alpha/beta hydrolase [Caulobacter sp. 17J65-9]NEX91603.1 alpha/beta hydrolase [Caulobacter sp. 17J65-9]
MFRLLTLALAAVVAVAAPAQAKAPFKSDRIIVTTVGQGPDVVLIPGLSSSPKVWEQTVKDHPGYRFHLVQLNGFAGAPVGGATTGDVAAPAAEEIARYISEQHLKKPAVIGHSMGGTMAMMVAARHPDEVSKVMVVDMLPFMGAMFGPPGSTSESLKPTAERIRKSMVEANDAQRAAALNATIAGMIRTVDMRPLALADAQASDQDVSARAFAELILTDLRPELKSISAPLTVLFVRGNNAPVTDAQMEGFYKASFVSLPAATLKRIPDSDHFIMFDQPKVFADEVSAFLKN